MTSRRARPSILDLRLRILLVVAACATAVAGLLLAPAAAAADRSPRQTIVRIYHQPLAPTLVQGSGLGTVRTFFTPIAVDGRAADGQYMVGTLTTVAVDVPGNQELRQANLAFVVGDPANQLILGGVSLYPAAGSTLGLGVRTIRPVIGGSGTFDGARGYAVSVNHGDRGWVHVFHLLR